jgi:hypothetical protein
VCRFKGPILQSKECSQISRKYNERLNAGNPVIADWVHFRMEYLKECSAGGCAQRQAALRGKVAGGGTF